MTADTDLDFIEANQTIQALDERIAKLREQIGRIEQQKRDLEGLGYPTAMVILTFDAAEDEQALRACESAKRKLSDVFYPDEPVYTTLGELARLARE